MEKNRDYFCGHLWEKGKREKNQDGLAFWWMSKKRTNCFFAVVCDGIGGLSNGEDASTYVVRQLISWFLSEGFKESSLKRAEKKLRRILFQIHSHLKEYGNLHKIHLGTTVTFYFMRDNYYLWGHSGDSRLYVLSPMKAEQITKDHKQAKGQLWKAIGAGEWKQPDFGIRRLKRKEKLLLCTDGFYRGLTEDDLRGLAGRKIVEEKQASRLLHQMYNRKEQMGEQDNISAVYFGRLEG